MHQMLHHYKLQSQGISQRFQVACKEVSRLRQSHSQYLAHCIERIEKALEQLPLTTAEFQLAMKRLENVHEYSNRCEDHAAAYEARLLLGLLRRCQEAFIA